MSETNKQLLSYLDTGLDTWSYKDGNYISWQTLMLKLPLPVGVAIWNHIKKPTWFKNPDCPTCIDLLYNGE